MIYVLLLLQYFLHVGRDPESVHVPSAADMSCDVVRRSRDVISFDPYMNSIKSTSDKAPGPAQGGGRSKRLKVLVETLKSFGLPPQTPTDVIFCTRLVSLLLRGC